MLGGVPRTRFARRLAGLLCASAVAAAGAAGCGGGTATDGAGAAPARGTVPAVPEARTDAFDGRRAFAHLRAQVRLGPRPAGSAASRRLAASLRRQLPAGRFEPVPGHPPGMRNVVGRLPGRGPAILVGAHYDTIAIPGFVGANDGAAGTAAVVELSRGLRRTQRACSREIRFVLFDGEEAPVRSADFLRDGLRGSKHHAARHGDGIGAVIILDFIANHGVRLPREAGSHPGLWARLRASAARVGVAEVFPPHVVPEILDDHTPFARRGIPAIDLIDFSYPHFHRRSDDLRAVSERSLDAVGEAVHDLVRREADAGCR